jgi:hypothetical protein
MNRWAAAKSGLHFKQKHSLWMEGYIHRCHDKSKAREWAKWGRSHVYSQMFIRMFGFSHCLMGGIKYCSRAVSKTSTLSSTGELNTAPELPAKCQRVWSTGKIEEGHRKEKRVDERHTAHACHKRMKRLLQSCQQNVSAYHPLANSRKDTAKEKRVNDTLLMS